MPLSHAVSKVRTMLMQLVARWVVKATSPHLSRKSCKFLTFDWMESLIWLALIWKTIWRLTIHKFTLMMIDDWLINQNQKQTKSCHITLVADIPRLWPHGFQSISRWRKQSHLSLEASGPFQQHVAGGGKVPFAPAHYHPAKDTAPVAAALDINGNG